MTDANRKPWLTASEQIDHLKSRGVHFSLMSEDDARAYLEKNSNYFRLRAYRLGFPKVEEGARKGEYANLDFKMLVDLSIVDMLLRYEMLPLTLDVEHFAKVKLFKAHRDRAGGRLCSRLGLHFLLRWHEARWSAVQFAQRRDSQMQEQSLHWWVDCQVC